MPAEPTIDLASFIEPLPTLPGPTVPIPNPTGLPAPPPTPPPAPPPSVAAVQEASLDDQSITTNDFTLYKGRKGIVDRIYLLNPKSMKSARSHYQENKGYFLCHSKYEIIGGQEVCTAPALCCQKLDESKKRFAALILQYTVGPDGQLVNPLSYTFKLWRISDDRFVMLRDIHNEFPLDAHDLVVRCTEESFQKLTIQASAKCIVLNPAFPAAYRDQITNWVRSMTPKAAKSLGRQLSDQELRERLGVAVTPSAIVTEMPVVDVSALLADL